MSVPYGGGVLGAVLAYPLTRAMDSWGASLLLLFVMGADLVLLFRVSMASVGEKVGGWAQQAMEQAKERYQENREERLRRREERLEAYFEEEEDEEDLDEPDPEPEEKPPVKKRMPEISLPAIKPEEPKVLYLEDIVSQQASAEKTKKRRGKGALPEYLEPQKAAFAVYDLLPNGAAREAAPPDPGEDSLPPWEPLEPQPPE
ncbi:MAG TPA: DNA translocase FtsK 4TM domain-containing protein, partial [Clostridia bacterium]|nr:DNA translocase FtsK 4TM domain-containing protein [Clostridia bacterium]